MAVLQAQDVVEWVLGVFHEELGKDTVLSTSWANTNVFFLGLTFNKVFVVGEGAVRAALTTLTTTYVFSLHPFLCCFQPELVVTNNLLDLPPPSPPKPKTIVLPPNWKTARDPEGKIYYYHVVTR